jgi:DNA-directed RNA polymerase subunit RPC12/RpoP
MSSLSGFRCGRCRAELLARAEPGPSAERKGWTPPVLCCGQPLRALEPDQLVLIMPSRRRAARCPRCGYQIRLVVHPAGSLVCMVCQTDFVILEGTPERPGLTPAEVSPTADAA